MSLGKLLPVTERSRNYKVTETATVHQRKKTKGPTDQRINDDSSCYNPRNSSKCLTLQIHHNYLCF